MRNKLHKTEQKSVKTSKYKSVGKEENMIGISFRITHSPIMSGGAGYSTPLIPQAQHVQNTILCISVLRYLLLFANPQKIII